MNTFLLAKTLAQELGPYGINSNVVGPGLIGRGLTRPILRNQKFMKKYEDLIPARRTIAARATFRGKNAQNKPNLPLMANQGLVR